MMTPSNAFLGNLNTMSENSTTVVLIETEVQHLVFPKVDRSEGQLLVDHTRAHTTQGVSVRASPVLCEALDHTRGTFRNRRSLVEWTATAGVAWRGVARRGVAARSHPRFRVGEGGVGIGPGR